MQLQRTILWIVFSMSLLFLWDSWQRHNGRPSMFGGAPATQSGAPPAGTGKAGAGAPAAKADPSVPVAPAQ
ncbi:MAG TPA: membrane protein insertase YidC, partial [Burkholderiaceae bacterium]